VHPSDEGDAARGARHDFGTTGYIFPVRIEVPLRPQAAITAVDRLHRHPAYPALEMPRGTAVDQTLESLDHAGSAVPAIEIRILNSEYVFCCLLYVVLCWFGHRGTIGSRFHSDRKFLAACRKEINPVDFLSRRVDQVTQGEQLRERRIFKVAAGQSGRDLREVFIAKDFAAIGPGRFGDWSESSNTRKDYGSPDDPPTVGDKRALNAMVEIAKDDLAVLAVGQDLVSVGRVDEGYSFNENWGRFGQWDLLNSIRVKWADPGNPEVEKAFESADSGEPRPKVLARGRLCRLHSEEVRRWVRRADRNLEDVGYWERNLDPPRLPFDDPLIKDPDRVFRGLPEHSQEAVKGVFRRAELVREGMNGHNSYCENGAVALLVTPFLEALGWSPEFLAFELSFGRKRADIAGFEAVDSDTPCFLVEAKSPGTGMDWARNQVEGYASQKNLGCPVFTTDGFYWALFAAPDDPEPCGELLIPDVREGSGLFFDKLLEFDLVRS